MCFKFGSYLKLDQFFINFIKEIFFELDRHHKYIRTQVGQITNKNNHKKSLIDKFVLRMAETPAGICGNELLYLLIYANPRYLVPIPVIELY